MAEPETGFEEVANRLKAALGLTSDAALAERLGMERTAFVQRKRRDSLPVEQIDVLCEAAKLNRPWVYEGKGEMRAGGGMAGRVKSLGDAVKAVESLSLAGADARLLQELLMYVSIGDRERVLPIVRRLGLVTVPRYDIAASAGGGQIISVHDEKAVVDYIAMAPEWLREIGVARDHIAVISVRGDSMEETLRDGDLILVDTRTVERKTPGVYVIVKGDALLVKRLNFRVDGRVEIRSDNKAYPTETLSGIEFEQLHIAGRMVRRVVR
jgi:SOS-response transcriptional repressor LexA